MRQTTTPVLEARLGGLRALTSPVRRFVKGAYADSRQFLHLRKKIRSLGHDTAMAQSMRNYIRGSGEGTLKRSSAQNARYLERLSRELKGAKAEYRDVAGRQAVRLGGAAVGISGVGYGLQSYRLRKAQVSQRPQYRQMDVYPEHGFAAVGATKYRRPYYDTRKGGRETPFRSGSPALGESFQLSESERHAIITRVINAQEAQAQ